MGFVKLIEFHSNHMDLMDKLIDRWIEETEGRRTSFRSIVGRTVSEPTHYIEVVEFPTVRDAEHNTALSLSSEIHEEMLSLCEGEPRVVDLDIIRDIRF